MTQLPYALVVGATSALFASLPAGFGCPALVALLLSFAVLVAIVLLVGQRVEDAQHETYLSKALSYVRQRFFRSHIPHHQKRRTVEDNEDDTEMMIQPSDT